MDSSQKGLAVLVNRLLMSPQRVSVKSSISGEDNRLSSGNRIDPMHAMAVRLSGSARSGS